MKLVSADLVLDYANKIFQAHATYELDGTGPEAAMAALESVGTVQKSRVFNSSKENEETIEKLNNTIAEQTAQIAILNVQVQQLSQASQRDIRTIGELQADLAKVKLIPEPPAEPVRATDVAVGPSTLPTDAELLKAEYIRECAAITPGPRVDVLEAAYQVFQKYKTPVAALKMHNSLRTSLITAIADCLDTDMEIADQLFADKLRDEKQKTLTPAVVTAAADIVLERWNTALRDPRVKDRKTDKQRAVAALAICVNKDKSCSVSEIKEMAKALKEKTGAPYTTAFWDELLSDKNGKPAIELLAKVVPSSLGFSAKD